MIRTAGRIGILIVIASRSFCFAGVADLRAQASAAFEEGRTADAERALRTLLKSTPHDPAALGFLASVLDRQHRLDEADVYYKRALGISPASLFILNNYGNHCEQRGDLACAEQQFRKVITIDPAHRNANLHLARLAAAHKDGAGALAFLEHAEGVDPNDSAVAVIRAEALYWNAHREESAALVTSLIERGDGRIEELVPVAAALVRMRLYVRALTLLAELRKQAPENTQVLLLLAKSLEQLNRYREAAVAYDDYLKLSPGDELVKRDRAFLDVRMTASAGALPVLKMYHLNHPRDPQGTYELAVATSVTDMRAASRLLTQSLTLAPDFTAARYARAIAFKELDRLPEAMADLEQAYKSEPENPEIAATLGDVYLSLRKSDKAIAVLRQAQTYAPYDRSVLVVLSRALKAEHNLDEAKAVLAQIPQTDPPAKSTGPGLLQLLNLAP